jgi:hypothetical protein
MGLSFFFLFLIALMFEKACTQTMLDGKEKEITLVLFSAFFSFSRFFFFSYCINIDIRRRYSSVSWSICFAAAVTVRYESCLLKVIVPSKKFSYIFQ